MIENIRLSLQSLWAHKLRSFLTMLGIIIGIAAIIALVSTIEGVNEQIKNNLLGSGDNLVRVKLYDKGQAEYYRENNEELEGVPVISEKTRSEIESLKTVKDVSLYLKRDSYSRVAYNTKKIQGIGLFGIDSHYFSTCNYKVLKGRSFLEMDYTNNHKVVILDELTAIALFGSENPLDKTIEIGGEPFIVIGVVEKQSTFEPVIETIDDYYMYMDNYTNEIFIPYSTWPILNYFDEPQNVIIKATSTDDMVKAGSDTEEILNSTIISTDNTKYKAEGKVQQIEENEQLGNSTNMLLIFGAGIALITGGIGVMNIMMVSVTERTREIGLKKALGAKKMKIMLQFLTEAAVLTCIGGILGVIAGVGLSKLISSFTGAPVYISFPTVIIAISFSMLIGIVFGIFPSYKAAKLNPIDALRYE